MHQVLHFQSEPAQAVREAARILAPGGRLLIVDFAPHELEFLRQSFAHERLGFPVATIGEWLTDCGLETPVVQELKPPAGAGGDKLTVTLWLAQRAGARPHASQSTHSRMEVTG
jgi:ArsR family transcriptional regulator